VGGWSGTIHEVARLSASDGAYFDSIAIDGQTVVAGSSDASDGGASAAYVFDEPPGGWSGGLHQSAKLVAGGDGIGSVAISGQTIAATSVVYRAFLGRLYVFGEPSGGWSGTLHESATAEGSWNSVAVSGQAIFATAETGAPTSPVYVFSEPSGGWSGPLENSAQLTASDGGYFAGVASSDQTVVASSGQVAYVFTEPAGGWANEHQSARLTDPSGETFPVAISGPTVVANAYGLAHVFVKPPSGWSDAASTAIVAATGARRTGNAALRGLAARSPALTIKLSTGCLPPTQALTITLPPGLTFTHNRRTLARALRVTLGGKSRVTLSHGHLTIVLSTPAAIVGLTIHPPGMIESNALLHRVRTRHRGITLTLAIALVMRDAAGASAPLALKAPAR
jgi:hypothetical protein